jgi:signal transduction histidine kinase
VTDRLESLAACGALAGGVAAELAAPLSRIQKMLAETVRLLDRHVAVARGPEPLAWERVSHVREQVAGAYLEVGRVARLAADLAAMIATPADAVEVDVNELVERAVSLARHRLGEEGEILLDLGTLPRIRVDGARLVQAIAHVLLIAADETGPGATCVVTTTADESGGIRIIITHPAVRAPDREPPFWHLVTENIAAARGTVGEARSAAEVVVDVRIPASE